jgi:hypothetical protein
VPDRKLGGCSVSQRASATSGSCDEQAYVSHGSHAAGHATAEHLFDWQRIFSTLQNLQTSHMFPWQIYLQEAGDVVLDFPTQEVLEDKQMTKKLRAVLERKPMMKKLCAMLFDESGKTI